jgi:fatty acid desaturase
VFRAARVWLAIYLAVIALAIATGSVLPLMYVGLPSLFGAWLHLYFGLTQHAGLAEDTLDHRLNSRTVYMNPVFRFMYWNMNYHVEHHMFPLVPYHALPALHEAMKADTPPPYPSTIAAYREIVPALLRQRKDPTHFVRRPVPGGRPAAAGAPAAVPAE